MNWLHQTKLVALGSPSTICQEEGWEYEVVCGLPGAERSYHKKKVLVALGSPRIDDLFDQLKGAK